MCITIVPKLFNITYHDWQTLVFIHNIFSTRLLQFIRPVKEEKNIIVLFAMHMHMYSDMHSVQYTLYMP
jgi:hypothetical protein